MKILKHVATAALAMFVATSAHSATLTATSSTGYKSGTSAVTFNINPSWNGTDTIRTAVVNGYYSDDNDRQFVRSTQVQTGSRRVQVGVDSYGCGIFNQQTCYRPIYGYVPVYAIRYEYFDASESARLQFGSQSQTVSTSYYDQATTRERTYGYRGGGPFSIVLDAANLADLASDGILSGSLFVGGDIILQSMRLTVTTTPAPTLSTVPLPASALFLLAGLGGFGVLRSRSNR